MVANRTLLITCLRVWSLSVHIEWPYFLELHNTVFINIPWFVYLARHLLMDIQHSSAITTFPINIHDGTVGYAFLYPSCTEAEKLRIYLKSQLISHRYQDWTQVCSNNLSVTTTSLDWLRCHSFAAIAISRLLGHDFTIITHIYSRFLHWTWVQSQVLSNLVFPEPCIWHALSQIDLFILNEPKNKFPKSLGR